MSALRVLLEITAYSAVLFAAIMLVKTVFKKQLSPSMQYFIWFLLIARLLLPVTLQSGVTLFTIPHQEAQTIAAPASIVPDAAIIPSATAPETTSEQPQTPAAPQTSAPVLTQPSTPEMIASEAKTAPVAIPLETLLFVWIAGALAVGARTLCSYAGLSKKIKRTSVPASPQLRHTVAQMRHALGIRSDLKIRVQSVIDSPALTASFFPTLLLPLSLLDDPQRLDFALRHELTHFKRRDYIVCILLLVLRAVYWFNPFVWLMQRNMKADMEFACDNMAASSLSSRKRKEYAQTVLAMFSGRHSQQPVLGMSLGANRRTAEKRIRGVFMRSKTRRGMRGVCVIVAAVLFAACFTTACQPVREIYPGITSVQKFVNGTTVGEVDVSGMTFEQGREAVAAFAASLLGGQQIAYTMPDNENRYVHPTADAGVEADVVTALRQAMTNGGDVALSFTVDETKLSAMVRSDSVDWDRPAPTFEVEKGSDEAALTTYAAFAEQALDGVFRADTAALAAEIKKQADAGTFTEFSVPGSAEATQPPVLMAEYSTAFKTSAQERRYNIWKAADLINGVRIDPGQTWSMNEAIGPRTYDRGWKGAPGIIDGQYEEVAGGGADQATTTLYVAALMGELAVVERTHHTWPLDYVPGGLDATTSTGAPDLKLKNPYDVPVYIFALCDGDADTIRVQIYGPGFTDGLTRSFTSELRSSAGQPKETTYLYDPSLSKGTEETVQLGHASKEYVVYKQYLNANGDVVKSEEFGTEVYDSTPAIIRTGDPSKAQ